MNVSQASKIWLDYNRAHLKIDTVRAYEFVMEPPEPWWDTKTAVISEDTSNPA